jgi:hypothetical protein
MEVVEYGAERIPPRDRDEDDVDVTLLVDDNTGAKASTDDVRR